MKAVIVNNYVTPYREDLFAEIHNLRDLLEVDFLYVSKPESKRLSIGWTADSNAGLDSVILANDPTLVLPRTGNRMSLPFRSLGALSSRKYDVIVCTLSRDMLLVQLLCLVIARLRRARLVYWVGDVEGEAAPSIVKRLIDRMRLSMARQANGFIFYSRKSQEWADARNIQTKRVSTWIGGQVRQAIKAEISKPARPRTPAHPVLRLLLVGGDDARKGLGQLLLDLSAIADRVDKQIEILLVGGDKQYRTRQNRVRIISIGRLQASGMKHAYASADMAVIASSQEPWGFVFNEAILEGRPCVVSEYAGSSTLASLFGLSYTPGAPSSLEAALHQALSISAEDKEKLSMHLSVPRAAKNFVDFAQSLTTAGSQNCVDY